MQQKTKNILLGFFLLLLLAPLLNQQLRLVPGTALHGAVRGAADTAFTFRGWWNGSWQEQRTAWINDSIGFRNELVQLNNQVDYTLFRKTHAAAVVVGKEGYLYEESYIRDYLGLSYEGTAEIRKDMLAARGLQDTLERKGVRFVVVHAPSKASFYPEFFPPAFDGHRQARNNQQEYVRIGDSLGVHQLDFNRWFVSMRATQQHLLMSRKGVHWTLYGSLLAGDSLLHYLEGVLGADLPDMVWEGGIESDTARYTDDDLAAGLNLVFPLGPERYYYPSIRFRDNSSHRKPKIIYISDSFFWPLLQDGIPQHTGSGWEFWYYFNERWTQSVIDGKEPVQVLTPGYRTRTFFEADAVVVICTDPNLGSMLRKSMRKAYREVTRKPL